MFIFQKKYVFKEQKVSDTIKQVSFMSFDKNEEGKTENTEITLCSCANEL